jgi:hypothetical protein
MPCPTERKMLEHLTQLFDAYVYNNFLELLHQGEVPVAVEVGLNNLYNIMMTLLHSYNVWVQGMLDIRQNYMKPLMNRIKDSPAILREIVEQESSQEAVKAAIGRPEEPDAPPVDKRTIKELNLISSRRPLLPPKLKSRYRREHTV